MPPRPPAPCGWSVYVCATEDGTHSRPATCLRALPGAPLSPAPRRPASFLEKPRRRARAGHPLGGTRSCSGFPSERPPGTLAAGGGGKGRGPARPLTHPVRARLEGTGTAGGGGNPFRAVGWGEWRAEGEGGGGATEQITPRRAPPPRHAAGPNRCTAASLPASRSGLGLRTARRTLPEALSASRVPLRAA